MQPYMPDEARARMPNSILQPLPAYLREDFAQSLDKSRPHELIPEFRKGKAVAPSKLGTLRYRYLDTGETTSVPNIWYNQTREMRLSWWDFEVQRTAEKHAQLEAELSEAKACNGRFYKDLPVEKAIQRLTWAVSESLERLNNVKQVEQDVRNGVKFL